MKKKLTLDMIEKELRRRGTVQGARSRSNNFRGHDLAVMSPEIPAAPCTGLTP